VRGGQRYAIIADVCAFANTNGGTLFVGVIPDPKKPPFGVAEAEQAIAQLEKELDKRISPDLACSLDVYESGGKKIVVIQVPRGEDPPYAVDDNKIYVRSEAETDLAVRDEIVGLVLRNRNLPAPLTEATRQLPVEILHPQPVPAIQSAPKVALHPEPVETAPRTGVEVMAVDTRDDETHFTMRDLRNGNVVNNVTRKSARRLWHYAITTYASMPADIAQMKVKWQGTYGLIRKQKQGKLSRYDLIQRTEDGYRFYFGVTDDGIHGPWKQLVGLEED
jgi:Schlafen, AlbA_2